MTINNYKQELELLKHLDICEEKKISFIDDLYRLSHINFKNFSENNWQILN